MSSFLLFVLLEISKFLSRTFIDDWIISIAIFLTSGTNHDREEKISRIRSMNESNFLNKSF